MAGQKFKTGDKVRIAPKYKQKYNGITTVGTVLDTWNNNSRVLYTVLFEGKKFKSSFYSYELTPAVEEKKEDKPKTQFVVGQTVYISHPAFLWMIEHGYTKYFTPHRKKVVAVTEHFGKTAYRLEGVDDLGFYDEDLSAKPVPHFSVGQKVTLSSCAKDWLKRFDHLHIYVNDPDAIFTISKIDLVESGARYFLEEVHKQGINKSRTLEFYDEDFIALPDEKPEDLPHKFKVGDKVVFTQETMIKLGIEKANYFGESTIEKLPQIIRQEREITWYGSVDGKPLYQVSGETFGKYFFEYELEPAQPTKEVKSHNEYKGLNWNEYRARLESNWKEICNRYLELFCKKHGFKYDPADWIGSDPGTIIEVCDMFVSMDNIRYDVDNNIPVGDFEKWYWKNLELYELGVEHWMNFPSYCKGAPDEWTEERIARLKDSKKRIHEAEEDLKRAIEEVKSKSVSGRPLA
jgi:hypothetical protein